MQLVTVSTSLKGGKVKQALELFRYKNVRIVNDPYLDSSIILLIVDKNGHVKGQVIGQDDGSINVISINHTNAA